MTTGRPSHREHGYPCPSLTIDVTSAYVRRAKLVTAVDDPFRNRLALLVGNHDLVVDRTIVGFDFFQDFVQSPFMNSSGFSSGE